MGVVHEVSNYKLSDLLTLFGGLPPGGETIACHADASSVTRTLERSLFGPNGISSSEKDELRKRVWEKVSGGMDELARK